MAEIEEFSILLRRMHLLLRKLSPSEFFYVFRARFKGGTQCTTFVYNAKLNDKYSVNLTYSEHLKNCRTFYEVGIYAVNLKFIIKIKIL